jgi:hypothetical protein
MAVAVCCGRVLLLSCPLGSGAHPLGIHRRVIRDEVGLSADACIGLTLCTKLTEVNGYVTLNISAFHLPVGLVDSDLIHPIDAACYSHYPPPEQKARIPSRQFGTL